MHLLFLLPAKRNTERSPSCSNLSHVTSLTQEHSVGSRQCARAWIQSFYFRGKVQDTYKCWSPFSKSQPGCFVVPHGFGIGKNREERRAAAVVTALKSVFLLHILNSFCGVWCLLRCKQEDRSRVSLVCAGTYVSEWCPCCAKCFILQYYIWKKKSWHKANKTQAKIELILLNKEDLWQISKSGTTTLYCRFAGIFNVSEEA